MKRIRPPSCICCPANAIFESESWPSLRLCHECWRKVCEYIIDQAKVTHGNPILLELIGGTDNGETDSKIRYWKRVGASTFTEFWIRVAPDSKK